MRKGGILAQSHREAHKLSGLSWMNAKRHNIVSFLFSKDNSSSTHLSTTEPCAEGSAVLNKGWAEWRCRAGRCWRQRGRLG